MNKITSVTTLETSAGMRISATYAVIDADGKIVNDNVRVNRIVMDEEIMEHIRAIENYAKTLVE